ncbi:Predicted PurR-regulated permease PerM [Marininema mesophilum]|uniref:Predicted PurR-regulated permease PerM n=1 Tax=Marininema mesophilum TaxID=1048340 RepID=A0A1H3BMY2_9BACL|nr:AI-2E family transporter [Marininema mesophilum]SDX43145.1 Predicted PurR-regulated permease PerM [Marininema mesophilum]
MPQSKPFRYGYAILLTFLIIYMGTKIDFVFRPFVILVQTLFFPFLVAGVLYYLFRPVVRALERKKIPPVASILLIYGMAAGLITLAIVLGGPPLTKQITELVSNIPALMKNLQAYLIDQQKMLQNNPYLKGYITQENPLQGENLNQYISQFTDYLNTSYTSIVTNIANFIGIITGIVVVFVTVPFILFYMLKEGESAPKQVLRFLPPSQRVEGRKILNDMDNAVSSYIQGQVLVSFCIGVLVYIGYLIIGLEYSLLLALVTMCTNIIPFIGPLIGTIPAVIVALTTDPPMVWLVLIVVIIVQQIEGNFISPQVMGRTLNIHPLTIILLLLVAGSLGGFLGLLLAVPTYAILKVIVSHTYRLLRLRNRNKRQAAIKKEGSDND